MRESFRVVEGLRGIRRILLPDKGFPVEGTVAREWAALADGPVLERFAGEPGPPAESRTAVVRVVKDPDSATVSGSPPLEGDRFVFSVNERGGVFLLASRPHLLYAGWRRLLDFRERRLSEVNPLILRLAFPIQRSVFDLYLTQYARVLRNFRREDYIREYARLGFSHIEVNGLAETRPLERGVPGEFYPEFYTYCPALDQFSFSRLNRGLYPEKSLAANRQRLARDARTALDYGLTPGLLCFEPRSVPEEFFRRYPTLRGARVDHPFRSFKPRFNLSIAHPAVREHYSELLANVLKAVPELDYLAIWTNDSGAGFEHTRSLYAGRNGGAFLIREWKSGEKIAGAAAANLMRFLRTLLETGRSINPNFRVLLRLEPLAGEMDFIWPELGGGIDVEAHSLLARGWEANYPHPRYPGTKVLGSAWHNHLRKAEKTRRDELALRGGECHFFHALASHANHEPLLGIPFPWLALEKLSSAYRRGLPALSHLGGIQPPDRVPYAVNQEAFRRFQMDPGGDLEGKIRGIAVDWVGGDRADALLRIWRRVDDAVRSQPPMSLYSGFGVVWQRLLVRPLVPDIDRIPEDERAYYENYMCTSIHNPNRVDLARDVLFVLITPRQAAAAWPRFDQNVLPPLAEARRGLREEADKAAREGSGTAARVFEDFYWRIRALNSLCETLRSTAVWIHAVHGAVSSRGLERRKLLDLLQDMIDREIANARDLIQTWESSPVEWMTIAEGGERPFIHGANLGELLYRKIDLMERYREAEPFIDPDYMYRLDGGFNSRK